MDNPLTDPRKRLPTELDEDAALAAADAEIDAEDEDLDDDLDPGQSGDELRDARDPAEDESEDRDGNGEEAEPTDAVVADAPPAMPLTGRVYARIHACLSTQLAAIEAQIARAKAVAESDPFFDRWQTVLRAQRERLLAQMADIEAKSTTAAPDEAEPVLEHPPIDDEGESEADAPRDVEPQTLSA